jgi:hypothetical protein
VEDGETLCTLAMIEVDDQREQARYEASSIPESVDLAHEDLRDQLRSGGHAALVMDGYATDEAGSRTDALIVELFGPGARSLGQIVQPYRAARRSRIPFVGRASGFAIIGEPIISHEIQVPDAEAVLRESVREHPEGRRMFG